MNWTKFLIATLIGGVAYFFLGWGMFGMVLNGEMGIPKNITDVVQYPEAEFKISYMAISCFVWASLFVFIFMRWANISTFMGGLKAGLLISFLIVLAINLGLAAQFRLFNMNTTMLNIIGDLVCSGLMAGLIGWFLGRD